MAYKVEVKFSHKEEAICYITALLSQAEKLMEHDEDCSTEVGMAKKLLMGLKW